MRIIHTENLTPSDLSRSESLYVYNGLDTLITFEVLEALLPQLSPVTQDTYIFSRDLQGPILEMGMRGLLVDLDRRDQVIDEYYHDTLRLQDQLDVLFKGYIGETVDWRSPQQLCKFFYDDLELPVVWSIRPDGSRARTVDRKALEKLEHYMYAEPIIRHLYALRDLGKKTSFLKTAIDNDGRLRTSFNIAGTTTGRLASSYSDFGTGTNLQNVENRLRSVFVADPGYKFCNIDLEQGDSRGVGAIHWNLFRDPSYLDACESGDLHTTVAAAAFRDISNRSDADKPFYRNFSFRDAAKRLGHGTNYQGQPEKMARETHIPYADVAAFQAAYLKQFPAFKLWWRYVEESLRDTRKLTTILGRQRYFFGHHRDPDTIRAAIAYEPQSITADTIDRGLLALWRSNRVQLLLQVHDSVLFQFREELEDEIVPWAIRTIEQVVRLKDARDFIIPAEAKVGWNWSDNREDPDSLRKFSDPNRPKKRTRVPGIKGMLS